MIHFFLICNKGRKVRLSKWYTQFKEQEKVKKIIVNLCLERHSNMCKFIEWQDYKIVYKRYASLYFIVCTDQEDNELLTLELIHYYVHVLDRYFSNVCELDIVFNFEKALTAIDEVFLDGKIQESSKREILKNLSEFDSISVTLPESGII